MRSFTEARILRDILWIVAAVLMLAVASPADASHRGNTNSTIVPPPGGCQFAIDNGCAAAPANGDFQVSSTVFNSTAVSDGGTNILSTYTPPANRAGVEYPVGRDKTLVLKDPTAIHASIPGCAYTTNLVTCATTSGADQTINGYDFSGASSGAIGCIGLRFAGANTSRWFMTNNLFKYSSTCSGTWISKTINQLTSFTSNDFDGNYAAAPNSQFMMSDGGSFTTDQNEYFYNYIKNVGGRLIGATRGFGHQFVQYNYIDGYGWGTSGASLHGEMLLAGGVGTPNSTKFDPVQFIGNTLVQPHSMPNTTYFTTNVYCETGSNAQFATSCDVENNTFIINNRSDGSTGTNSALFQEQWSGVDTVTIKNNVVYPHGAFSCTLLGGTYNQAGNVASTTGNTMYLTAIASAGTWIVPYVINNSTNGFTEATIQPYGTIDANTGLASTGTGGTGSYVFNGPPQTKASTNNWVVTPAIGTLTVSNNINASDGSTVDVNYPRGGGNCNNHG